MERYLRKPASVNFPEQLRVVRSASVNGRGVSLRASAFSVGRDGSCWRPGHASPEGLRPDAARALRRHAAAVDREPADVRRGRRLAA